MPLRRRVRLADERLDVSEVYLEVRAVIRVAGQGQDLQTSLPSQTHARVSSAGAADWLMRDALPLGMTSVGYRGASIGQMAIPRSGRDRSPTTATGATDRGPASLRECIDREPIAGELSTARTGRPRASATSPSAAEYTLGPCHAPAFGAAAARLHAATLIASARSMSRSSTVRAASPSALARPIRRTARSTSSRRI